MILNAKDFGIPQSRERAFCISELNGTDEIIVEEKGSHTNIHDFLDLNNDDLIEELKNRNYDFSKELDDYDIDCEYFNRGLGDNASVVDCLIQAAKTLAPRRILDKATIKEIINDFIDSSLDNRCYK